MAYSSKTYTGDGVTTDFVVTFDYLDTSHVYVSVDNIVTTAVGSDYTFTWINSTTVRVVTVIDSNPVPSGLEIRLFRQTPIASPAVVFGGGASLSSANLNKNSEYLTYALQEATDDNEAFTKLYLGSKSSFPTTDNEGDPLQTGAVIYYTPLSALYYWTGSAWIIGESTAAAETFKDQAEAARDAALAAQAAAETAETGAATAQTASEAAQTAAEAAQTGAEAAYDSFDDRYLGAKASDPTLDNDGDALLTGSLYFNTTDNEMRVYGGFAWNKVTLDALLTSNNLSDLTDTVAALGSLGILTGGETGALVIPDGTTAQRPTGGGAALFRYNTTLGQFEGWNGSAWGSIGGGGLFKGNNGSIGSAPGDIFRVNSASLSVNTTINADENASATGPLEVANGVTLTVNGNLAIL